MDDLESKLNTIFSSPESMEKIKNLANTLSGGESAGSSPPEKSPDTAIDPRVAQLIAKIMSEYSKPSETTGLISALRPYLSHDRAQKLDKAISIAKIAKIAKAVLPELGGDRRV